jgi:hypothetical protein
MKLPVRVEKKLRTRQKVSGSLKRFMAKAGISIGFSTDGFKTVYFENIPGIQNGFLYFSMLELPAFTGKGKRDINKHKGVR